MAVDFKFVPTSGSISGETVLSQTEAGFNELGERMDSFSEESAQALSTAQDALAAAVSAENTAGQAQTVASDAMAAARDAARAADTASHTAQNAMATANNALDTAANVNTAAQNAEAAAQAAQTAAENAEILATQANAASDNALSVAGQALSAALEDADIYVLEATANLDADEFHDRTGKYYLNGENPVNFPVNATPFYFDIVLNSDGTSVTQRVWTEDARNIWRRVAVVATEEEGVDTVTWTDWVEFSASGSSVTAHAATHATDGSDPITPANIGALSTTGTAAAAAKLATARMIGGVAFDGSANINLPGVNTAGNQNTTGTAAAWTTARKLTLTGAVTGSASIKGDGNVSLTTTMASGGTSAWAKPQTSAGVGQWTYLELTSSTYATLPAGGTWAYFTWTTLDNAGQEMAIGVDAGGTKVAHAPSDGFFTGPIGLAWRIS